MDNREKLRNDLGRMNVELSSFQSIFHERTGTDEYEALIGDGLVDSYEFMLRGIEADVALAYESNSYMPHIRKETVAWINGVPASYKYDFIANRGKPDYVDAYYHNRSMAYSAIMKKSLNQSNFDTFFSVMETMNDPWFAEKFNNTYYGKKQNYPHLIAGDVKSVLARIDSWNMKIDNLRRAFDMYAEDKNMARLKKQLHDDKVGTLGALAIGLKAKLNAGKKATKAELLDRVEAIAGLPRIEMQLVYKAQHGQSILED